MKHTSTPGTARPWAKWIGQAAVAAFVALSVGMLLLGMPGAIFLEAVTGTGSRKLPPDSVWPLAMVITFVGSLMIVPASLLVRITWRQLTGWSHAGATTLLTLVATFVFTVLITR
jgi:hypothetical protein